MRWTGPDWGLFKKISLVGFFGLVAWSSAPWAQCVFQRMDETQIVSVEEAHGHGMGNSPDSERADRAERFLGGFFGGFTVCYRANPIGADYPWQWPAIGGALALAILFQRLDRMQYARRIRKRSANYAAVDQIDYVKGGRKSGNREAIDTGDYFVSEPRSERTTGNTPAARHPSANRPATRRPSANRPAGRELSGGRPAARPATGNRDARRTPGSVAALEVEKRPDWMESETKKSDGPDWEWD